MKKRRKMKEIAKDIKENNKIPELGPPITRAEWLQTVINLTNISINDPQVGDGAGMKEQVERFTKELKGLKK
jgi:hypothetical protein